MLGCWLNPGLTLVYANNIQNTSHGKGSVGCKPRTRHDYIANHTDKTDNIQFTVVTGIHISTAKLFLALDVRPETYLKCI